MIPNLKNKDSNTAGTAGAHVGDTTSPKKSTTPSKRASIDTQVLEANEQSSCLSRTVEEILGAHPMSDDNFWGDTNPSDVSIDTMNSKEIMAGSHITEQHTHKYQGPVLSELLNVAPNKPQAYDLPQNHQLDFLNKLKDLNILSKMDIVTNNVTNTPATNFLSQENQEQFN